MHEHSFIQAIISNVENSENVKSVLVEVGDLAGIEPQHLGEHLIEETGWDVEIITKPGNVICECGFKGEPKIRERLHDMVIFECPSCGEVPKVLEGKDIKILKVVYN